jgi:hypothetical protein
MEFAAFSATHRVTTCVCDRDGSHLMSSEDGITTYTYYDPAPNGFHDSSDSDSMPDESPKKDDPPEDPPHVVG